MDAGRHLERRERSGGVAGCSSSRRCRTEESAAICACNCAANWFLSDACAVVCADSWSERCASICRSTYPCCAARALEREEWVRVGEGDGRREQEEARAARLALEPA